MVMIASVWKHCFGDVEGNKKAILERGWNPLNRGCLVHLDVEKTKPIDYENDSRTLLSTDVNSRNNVGVSNEEGIEESYAKVQHAVVIKETNGSTLCCNGDLCGMRTPLGPKDTHRCYTCKKRMHGGIFCALFENEDDYTGNMYCKKCGR